MVDSRAAAYLARALYYLLPNLEPFDIRAEVVHAQPVSLGYVAWTTGYAVAYIGALLLAAMFIFSRRDFK